MPRNGTGTYELPNTVNPVVTDTTITSTWANTTLDDIETELTNSLPRDGQAAPTANLPMGGYKLTGLGTGSASTDSVTYGQVFSSPAFTSPTAVASPAAGDDSLKLATTAFVQDVAMTAALPSQTGNSGKSITTDGTTASWGVSGVAGGGTGIASYTIGDILYASGATALSKLAAGTAGYALTSGGAGVAPSWAANVAPGAITTSGLTQATGKLLGRTTAGTGGIEEIAVSGATLSAGTLTISPPTAASGASMTLLSTVTAANSATVDIETTLDGTCDAYLIVISGYVPASDGAYLLVRSKLSGAYVTTGTYNWRHEYTSTGAAANSVESQVGAAETAIRMLHDTGNAAGESASCVMYVYNPSSTSLVKHFSWFGSGIRSNGAVQNQIGAGCNTGTGALTGIRFFASTGNITSGTFRLYGISNS